MKNTSLNKKVVAAIAGSIMSMSAISFSTGIVVAGATMMVPTISYAKNKVDRKHDKAVRKIEKFKRSNEKNHDKRLNAANKALDGYEKAVNEMPGNGGGVISSECGQPGQGAC